MTSTTRIAFRARANRLGIGYATRQLIADHLAARHLTRTATGGLDGMRLIRRANRAARIERARSLAIKAHHQAHQTTRHAAHTLTRGVAIVAHRTRALARTYAAAVGLIALLCAPSITAPPRAPLDAPTVAINCHTWAGCLAVIREVTPSVEYAAQVEELARDDGFINLREPE